jgi:hypothetical protein
MAKLQPEMRPTLGTGFRQCLQLFHPALVVQDHVYRALKVHAVDLNVAGQE